MISKSVNNMKLNQLWEINVCKKNTTILSFRKEAVSVKFLYRTFCLTTGMLPYVLRCLFFSLVLVEVDRCNNDDDDAG